MPKRRANGEGNIRKRKDGRWEGRYTVGHDPETGKAIIKNVLGKTQAEVKEKLKKAIEENVGIDYGRAKTYTVGNWLEVRYENYAKIKMRPLAEEAQHLLRQGVGCHVVVGRRFASQHFAHAAANQVRRITRALQRGDDRFDFLR